MYIYSTCTHTILITFLHCRYGQCWVLTGVAVTLLRALGIGCRPVTCYEAAHLCTKLGQVDFCFTPQGEMLDNATQDQLWYVQLSYIPQSLSYIVSVSYYPSLFPSHCLFCALLLPPLLSSSFPPSLPSSLSISLFFLPMPSSHIHSTLVHHTHTHTHTHTQDLPRVAGGLDVSRRPPPWPQRLADPQSHLPASAGRGTPHRPCLPHQCEGGESGQWEKRRGREWSGVCEIRSQR